MQRFVIATENDRVAAQLVACLHTWRLYVQASSVQRSESVHRARCNSFAQIAQAARVGGEFWLVCALALGAWRVAVANSRNVQLNHSLAAVRRSSSEAEARALNLEAANEDALGWVRRA